VADSLVPPWDRDFPSGREQWRAWVTDHLHHHPDHHHWYPKGHNFTLVSTMDIAREHERLHLGFFHDHDRAWRVLTKEKEESMSKLDLHVTVAGDDPDGYLARLKHRTGTAGRLIIASAPLSTSLGLTITSVERADGQPLGLESAFETWWAELHGEGDDADSPVDKEWARDAFLYGVKLGKEKA
jgi:hypothetical protein